MIRLELSKIDTNALMKIIERRVKATVQNVAMSMYGLIFEIDHRSVKYHSRYPFLTGSYMSSWRINEGSVDSSTTIKQMGDGSPRIAKSNDTLDYRGPWTPVYISNSVPYAEKLEKVGSPMHRAPWHVAAHSFQTTLLRYQLGMNPTITSRRTFPLPT